MRVNSKMLVLMTGWALLTLSGCKGLDGKNGANGVDGVDGADGAPGANGTNGTNGVDGQDGADGVDGQNGADGANGVDGAPGADGADGVDGTNGTNGVDGVDGQDGADGMDGMDAHQGDAPWGVHLTILSVDGASGSGGAFQVGDVPEITFTVTDDDGIDYDLADLSTIFFNMAGPTTHPQIVVWYQDITDVATASVYNRDGTYTYTFAQPIPATYHAVPNDTTDLGVSEGDWGGLALADGTYTIGGVAYINEVDDAGEYWADADNTSSQVLFGTATALEQYEVVLPENCAGCHSDSFRMHGGSRQKLEVCTTCHVDGAEDRYSSTDPTVTPGVNISMRSLIHKIHNGDELANAFEVAGYPADSSAAGYPDYNLVDYSDVAFPVWPTGTANCDTCHENAPDGDVETRPSRVACGSCHDGIDFTETVTTATDYHPGGPQTSDAGCAFCHTATAIEGYHANPRETAALWSGAGHGAHQGVNVTMLSAVNQSGLSVFQPGDTVTITFSVLYDDGTPIPQSFFAYSSTSSTCPTVAGSGTAVITGPSDYMQRIMYSQSASSSTVVGSIYGSSTVDTVTGIWTYTFSTTAGVAQTIPTTYPFQPNDNSTYVADNGDLYGQSLLSGTYRVGVILYTSAWEDTTCANGNDTSYRQRIADQSFVDVLVGSATTLEPHSIVTDAACESCHERVEFHGASRTGVDYCVSCHTRGATDTRSTPATSVYFADMIHSIHASGTVLDETYSVNGSTWDVVFPRQDGGVAACESCHGDNPAWKTPSEHACITCHNSDSDHAHAAIMTDPVYGESCETCHGVGTEFSVESVHEFTK